MSQKDDYSILSDSLWKAVGQYRAGKIKLKKTTPLGLPYLFKGNSVLGKAWTPFNPACAVNVSSAWVEEGNTLESECALWLDLFYSKVNVVGYYGA